MAQKRKRLPDLSKKQQQELYAFVKENYKTTHKNKLVEEIYARFNVKYKPSSIKYLVKTAKYPECVIEDQKTVDNWKKEYSEDETKSKEEIDAEALFNSFGQPNLDGING